MFSGTLLAGAKLPEAIARFDTLGQIAESSKNVTTLFLSTLAACVYALITVATTTDAGLLTNSATSTLPILSAQFPIVGFYYVAPLLLLSLYIYMHLHMQRLFDTLSKLPACFPDGAYVHEKAYPTLLNVFAMRFCTRLANARPPLFALQWVIVRFVFWGAVPATLFVIWARFLRRHAPIATSYHLLAFAASLLLGFVFQRFAFLAFKSDAPRSFAADLARDRIMLLSALVLVAQAVMSYRAIAGDKPRWLVPSYGVGTSISKRMPRGKWLKSGISRMFVADLVNARFDEKPDSPVADLSSRNLRYIRAWRVAMPGCVLVDTDLTGAELANANLKSGQFVRTVARDADLQDADLSEAKLAYADFEHAGLTRGNLHGAFAEGVSLRSATLVQADLGGMSCVSCDFTSANLKKANIRGATLVGPRFGGGSLEEADFTGSDQLGAQYENTMAVRATFDGAGLSEANFAEANLKEARFRPADQRPASLIGADFRRAQLDGADFTGALFFDADFRGVDLRKVIGLEERQLERMIIDARTQFPDELRRPAAARLRRMSPGR